MKKIAFLIFFLSVVTFINAQETENNVRNIEYPEREMQERLYLMGYHPLTGELLSERPYPYPVTGTPGDGNHDKLQFKLHILSRTEEYNINLLEQGIIRDAVVAVTFYPVQEGEPGIISENLENVTTFEMEDEEVFSNVSESWMIVQGEIPLTFDISPMQRLAYQATLLMDGTEISTFHTEITAGNPELTIHSKITTGGLIMSGALIFSEVSGHTALAFEPGYSRLKGRGPLTYEKFEIDPEEEGCTITTNMRSGDWRVEVVFPDDLTQIESSLDNASFLPPPLEVVIAIEPKISESATIRCPRGIPPVLPLPKLIHFFAGFFSFHGGEIPVAGQETPNELNRDRGGLVMTDWQPGTGNIIATRSYKRVGTRDKATFEEDTELVLKWPDIENTVPVCHQLGNGESQTINVNQSDVQDHLAHGDYEGECMTTICHQLGNCVSETISVEENEVAAHIAHGDYEGECFDCCFSGFLELELYTRFCNAVVDGIGTFYMANDDGGLVKITADSEGSLCEVRSSNGDPVADHNISFEEAKTCLARLMCIAGGLELVENCD